MIVVKVLMTNCQVSMLKKAKLGAHTTTISTHMTKNHGCETCPDMVVANLSNAETCWLTSDG
ncbi:Uncharacterised protein [Mycobacteroides abscessus subsp. abscessus]|nr:Uncharacterised protein [Mycobacteroides abscessus subsp. abscessus]